MTPERPSLTPAPGFNWKAVNWGAPHERISDRCSYCLAAIPEDSVPFRLWRPDRWAAVFCDACSRRWFGLETFPEVDDDEPEETP